IVVSGTDDGLAFESIALRNNRTVVIDTLPSTGKDSVTVSGTGDKADHKNQNLQITTGAGTDAVSITGAVSLAGDLSATSGTITTGAGITVGGAVTLDAAGNLTAGGAVTAGTTASLTAGAALGVNADLTAGGT